MLWVKTVPVSPSFQEALWSRPTYMPFTFSEPHRRGSVSGTHLGRVSVPLFVFFIPRVEQFTLLQYIWNQQRKIQISFCIFFLSAKAGKLTENTLETLIQERLGKCTVDWLHFSTELTWI